MLLLQKVTKMIFVRVIHYSPYKGKYGEKTLCNITKEVSRILPDKHKIALIDAVTKLDSNFNINEITKKQHKQELLYTVKCPEETFYETYNGQSRI